MGISGTEWNDMPHSVNDGGTWKRTQEMYVRDDVHSRRVFSGHINVAGTWKVFHIQDYEDNATIDFALNRAWPAE